MYISLISDDLAQANTASRALRAQGGAVDWSARGEPVAAPVKKHPYDLVVLDIGLAGIGGFETLRRLGALGSITPVLILILAGEHAGEHAVM